MNLDRKSIPAYMRRKKLLAQRESIIRLEQVGDGLKNLIFRVHSADRSWMLKQAHSKVQIKERWWIDRKRIFYEKSCIEILSQLFPPHILPAVVLEDRTDFVLVTTAPPQGAVLWETDLDRGRIDLQIAVQCGDLLATVHNQTAGVRDIRTMLRETKPFEQLRVDPLYHRVTQAFPELKKPIEAQARQLLKERHSLTLGDLRPRNVWVDNGQIYLVDFATAHFGNPAFDLAFYAADLCLKAMHNSPQKAAYLEAINVFWNEYFRNAEYPRKAEVEKSGVRHFGCLLLSAIDGRLPITYLDEHMKDLTRRIAQSLLFSELERIEDITEFINRTLIDD